MNKDKYFVYSKKYDTWMHRTPLKLIVNPILRKLQFWTNCPYVICSETIFVDGKPHFLNYSFGKMLFIRNWKPSDG